MSYLEGPKGRLLTIPLLLENTIAAHSTKALHPGCVQCGSPLDFTISRRTVLSGRCFQCENWISDEEDEVEELED